MNKAGIAAVAALALAFVPQAFGGNLVLAPTSYGAQTVASWRAQEGLPDTVGFANQALLLEKDTFDAGPAAVAVVLGLEGTRARALGGLEWERRIPISDCNATSPRWELVVQGRSGREYVVRFGCRFAAHAPGSAPNWVRDVNSKTAIATRLMRAGKDALAGTVESLAIVFDQRSKTGLAFLDNIKVSAGIETNVWTSAADNAAVPVGPPVWKPRVEPFGDDDFMTADDLWALLTPDDQALALSDDPVPY